MTDILNAPILQMQIDDTRDQLAGPIVPVNIDNLISYLASQGIVPPVTPSPSLSDYQDMVVVDAAGNGDYISLAAAFTGAPSGSTLLLFGDVMLSGGATTDATSTNKDFNIVGMRGSKLTGDDNRKIFINGSVTVNMYNIDAFFTDQLFEADDNFINLGAGVTLNVYDSQFETGFAGWVEFVGNNVNCRFMNCYLLGGTVTGNWIIIGSTGSTLEVINCYMPAGRISSDGDQVLKLHNLYIIGSSGTAIDISVSAPPAGTIITNCSFPDGIISSAVAWNNADIYETICTGFTNVTPNAVTAVGSNFTVP